MIHLGHVQDYGIIQSLLLVTWQLITPLSISYAGRLLLDIKLFKFGGNTMTTTKQKDDFKKTMKKQIDNVKSEIDDLEKKSKTASKDVQAKYQEQLKNARAAQKKLEKKMDELGKASEDTWDKIKDESEHAWKALSSSVNYFKSQFK